MFNNNPVKMNNRFYNNAVQESEKVFFPKRQPDRMNMFSLNSNKNPIEEIPRSTSSAARKYNEYKRDSVKKVRRVTTSASSGKLKIDYTI